MNRKSGRHCGRRSMKQVLVLALAFVLVIGASVGGTLAWLTAQSNEVQNTFTSATLLASDGSFTLYEKKAEDNDEDGRYELTGERNQTTNAYSVLPGVDIPKDPHVEVKNLQEHAYLYIVVDNDLPTGMSYTLNSGWKLLDGYSDVYVWTGTGANSTSYVIEASEGATVDISAQIISDDVITVADTYTAPAAGTEIKLSFSAYLVQATGNGADAVEAWNHTYGAP